MKKYTDEEIMKAYEVLDGIGVHMSIPGEFWLLSAEDAVEFYKDKDALYDRPDYGDGFIKTMGKY